MQQEVIECEYCEKKFISTSRLMRHLEKVHKTETLHKCDRCKKLFRMKWLMDCHSLSHDRFDQPINSKLKCASCSIEFSSIPNLNTHRQFHCPLRDGSESGEFEHSFKQNRLICFLLLCVCFFPHTIAVSLGFQHIDDLNNHIADHDKRKFECSICFQQFTTQFSLNRHRERHEEKSTITHDETQMGKNSALLFYVPRFWKQTIQTVYMHRILSCFYF